VWNQLSTVGRQKINLGLGDKIQWHQEVKVHFAARFLHQLNTFSKTAFCSEMTFPRTVSAGTALTQGGMMVCSHSAKSKIARSR